jgi:hypothetical protein
MDIAESNAKSVYIVQATIGAYEDVTTYPIAGFRKESDADRYISLVNASYSQFLNLLQSDIATVNNIVADIDSRRSSNAPLNTSLDVARTNLFNRARELLFQDEMLQHLSQKDIVEIIQGVKIQKFCILMDIFDEQD